MSKKKREHKKLPTLVAIEGGGGGGDAKDEAWTWEMSETPWTSNDVLWPDGHPLARDSILLRDDLPKAMSRQANLLLAVIDQVQETLSSSSHTLSDFGAWPMFAMIHSFAKNLPTRFKYSRSMPGCYTDRIGAPGLLDPARIDLLISTFGFTVDETTLHAALICLHRYGPAIPTALARKYKCKLNPHTALMILAWIKYEDSALTWFMSHLPEQWMRDNMDAALKVTIWIPGSPVMFEKWFDKPEGDDTPLISTILYSPAYMPTGRISEFKERLDRVESLVMNVPVDCRVGYLTLMRLVALEATKTIGYLAEHCRIHDSWYSEIAWEAISRGKQDVYNFLVLRGYHIPGERDVLRATKHGTFNRIYMLRSLLFATDDRIVSSSWIGDLRTFIKQHSRVTALSAATETAPFMPFKYGLDLAPCLRVH